MQIAVLMCRTKAASYVWRKKTNNFKALMKFKPFSSVKVANASFSR